MYVSNLGAVNSDVPAILSDMLRAAQIAGTASVESTGFLSRVAARDWVNNINNYLATLKDTLLKVKDGRPFYKRHADSAQTLLLDAERYVQQELSDLQAAKEDSLVQPLTASNYKGIISAYLRRAGTKIGEAASLVVDAAADSALSTFKKSPATAAVVALAGLLGVAYVWRSIK